METVTLQLGENEVVVTVAGIEWLAARLSKQEGAADLVARLNEIRSRETATALDEVRIGGADLASLRQTLTTVDEADLPPDIGGLLAFLDE